MRLFKLCAQFEQDITGAGKADLRMSWIYKDLLYPASEDCAPCFYTSHKLLFLVIFKELFEKVSCMHVKTKPLPCTIVFMEDKKAHCFMILYFFV